ncbi:hypothetical protein [Dongia deserti]|uniref:hypothetical protein n=1 Tax=Dongia deserti TaxID=2268030 RepID=UPI000E648ABE|nr:hypothetical protein [Dongia deserti]
MTAITLSDATRARIDEIRRVDERLRRFSKETLVQALCNRILTRVDLYTNDAAQREKVIDSEFHYIANFKQGARAENVHRRFLSALERLRNPKPRRRRRRKRRTA